MGVTRRWIGGLGRALVDLGGERPGPPAALPRAEVAPRPSVSQGLTARLARSVSVGVVGAVVEVLASARARDSLRALASELGHDVARAFVGGLGEGSSTSRSPHPVGLEGGVTTGAPPAHAAELAAGGLQEVARGPDVRDALAAFTRAASDAGAASVAASVNALIDAALERRDDLVQLTALLARSAGESGSRAAVDVAEGAVDAIVDDDDGPRPARDDDASAPRALDAARELGRAVSTGAARGVRAELPEAQTVASGVAGLILGLGSAAVVAALRARRG